MRKFFAAFIIALSAFALIPSTFASAQSVSGPALEVSDTTLAPGQAVTIAGDGFAPNSDVAITIESEPRLLKNLTVDASGNFSTTVEIPSDMPGGTHTLKASGLDPAGAPRVLSQTVTVSGSNAENGGGVGGNSPLPVTGANSGQLAGAGAVLLAAGGAFVALGRRRKLA